MTRRCTEWASLLLIAVMLMAGCGSRPDTNPPADPATLTPTPTLDLPEAAAGLDDLEGYTASLTVTFDGGAEEWSETYTMIANSREGPRQLTYEASEGHEVLLPSGMIMAEVGGILYQHTPNGACAISAISAISPEEGPSELHAVWEPALRLPPIHGAEAISAGDLAGVFTTHYSFDEDALEGDGITDADGEVWVAVEGGQVIGYALTVEDAAGTTTYDYALSGIGETLPIDVPDGCPEGVP